MNRLSFLRGDHAFLSAALKHPSTRFVLMKDLAPLTKSPAEPYYAKYDEIRKMVPETIYDKSEEDIIKEYDSRKTTASPIFLGLDETQKQDGLVWKIYTGTPYFALDVTPRHSEEQQANSRAVIADMEAKGLAFLQGRTIMSFPASEGTYLTLPLIHNNNHH